MTVRGTDLYSRYQRVTSWPAVRGAGYRFAYFKVGEGTTTRSVAALSPAAAKQNGQILGGYWYARPGNAKQQANLLCNRVEALGLTGLGPALDIEAPFLANKTAANFAVAFCRQVRARGHRPCLYGNNTMLRAIATAVKRAVPETMIWVARYGANPTVAYQVWQHSSSGHPPGIAASSVDLNKGSIPYNVTAQPRKADTMPSVKDLWGWRIPAVGANGKPRNPKKPKWLAQTVISTILQHTYGLHEKVDRTGASVWQSRVHVVNADGTTRDPKNPDWWASSVLATNLQHTYGLLEKVDALTHLVAQQQKQIEQLAGIVGKGQR